MAYRIIAGSTTDIKKDSGQWLIVDIGFSSSRPSCGVWNGTGEPIAVTFGCLVKLVTREAQKPKPRHLNLLLEAPLSVAFQQNGNPVGRSCDRQGNQTRLWYVNAGATTLIAAGYLLRALYDCQPKRNVRLFEGFVSFKRSEDRPNSKAEQIEAHKKDVLKLKDAVWTLANAEIIDLRDPCSSKNLDHRIESAFPFLDELLIPPVIRVDPYP